MRGLLIKDIELTLTNKKTIPVFLLIVLMMLATGDESMISFAVSFLTMICGMMVLSTISYDEYENGTSYLLTLPVTRTMYVIEKYVFTIVAMLTGFVISIIASLACVVVKGYDFDWEMWVVGCVATFFVLLLVYAIMIPILLKFGGENGRIVMVAFAAAVFAIAFAGARLSAWVGIDIKKIALESIVKIQGLGIPFLVAIAVIIMMAAFSISMYASNHVMLKKEF